MPAPKLIVGYDGSPVAEQALRWALDEGRRRRAAVELVYAWIWPNHLPSVSPVLGTAVWPDAEAERALGAMLADAAGRAAAGHPDVPVSSVTAHGAPAQVLRDRSADAELLVVGGHSHSALTGVVLGSVAVAVAAHAACSVVVVRGCLPDTDHRPILLGLDDGDHTDLAIGFAFEQAAARAVPLRAVHVWMPPPDPWIGSRFAEPEEIAVAEQVAARARLAVWRDKFPSVPVAVESVIGHPYRVLASAARDAQMVVVGARGRGGFRDLRLGSISRYLLHHGDGVIAVVRPERSG